jgi:hypothetical protein
MCAAPRRPDHPSALRFAATAVALFVVGVVGHNALSALFDVEEPFFFLLAVIVAPVLLVYGIVLAVANRL